jgi:hypothetical protein
LVGSIRVLQSSVEGSSLETKSNRYGICVHSDRAQGSSIHDFAVPDLMVNMERGVGAIPDFPDGTRDDGTLQRSIAISPPETVLSDALNSSPTALGTNTAGTAQKKILEEIVRKLCTIFFQKFFSFRM